MKFRNIILISALTVFTLAACRETTPDNPQDKSVIEEKDQPTEDQVTLTCDLETKVYGAADSKGFEKSLLKRLTNKVANFNDETTKLCVVSGPGIAANRVSGDDYLEIFRCYSNGGTILITSPDEESYRAKFLVEMGLAEYYYFVVRNDIRIDGQTPQVPEFYSEFQLDDVLPEEAADGVLYDCVAFNGCDHYYCKDADDPVLAYTEISDEETKADDKEGSWTGKKEVNDYQYGLYADATVSWIKKVSEETKAPEAQDFAKSSEKFSKTYTHDIDYWSLGFNKLKSVPNAISETIEIRMGHDVGEAKDFYYITQDMSFHSGQIEPVPNPANHKTWWSANYDYVGEKIDGYYITYFNAWNTTLTLSLKGCSPKAVSSSPQSENSSTHESRTAGTTTISTTSNGFSIGGSFGGSVGSGFAAAFVPSYTRNYTNGTSTTVTVGVSRDKRDIAIRKYTEAGDQTVRWEYTGNSASWTKDDRNNIEWVVGDLQISDMTQTNAVLFEVPDAKKGQATLTVHNGWNYKSSYGTKGNFEGTYKMGYYTLGRHSDTSITLPIPFRSQQHWVLSITKYGNITTPSKRIELSDYLISHLIGGNATFDMPDLDDASTTTAKGVLNLFTDDATPVIRNFGYRGEFEFSFQRQGDNKIIRSTVNIK